MPRYTRKTLDTNDQQVGQAGVATMPITGDAVIEHSAVEIPDGPVDKDFADALAFNNELMTIQVHTSTDKTTSRCVPVWVNGRIQMFIRGQEQTVKRMFVERLARCKVTSYTNEEFRDGDGNMSVRWPKTDSLAYPFSVIEDKNPNGPAWLRKILAEPS